MVTELESSPTETVVDDHKLLAGICEDSFYEFVVNFWDVIVQETPVFNWHIELLCKEFQKMAEDVFAGKPRKYDLVVNIPPGTTKSTILSRMFPAWVWTRMPSARFICASFTDDLATTFAVDNRDLVKSDKYQACWPHIKIKKDRDTKHAFANTLGGERRAYGAGGAVTGFHGHFIIVDDPIDPQAAVSEADLKRINRWMKDTLPSRKVDKAIVPTILIMQRLHQDDPSANMLERGDKLGMVRHICLPCDTSWEIKPKKLKRKYKKGLLDPIRLNRKVLDEAKTQGPYVYAGQYGQSPIPDGGGLFLPEKINLAIPPQLKHFKELLRYWDKAGTKDDGAFSVGALLGIDSHNRCWILDVVRGQWASHEREENVLSTARIDGYGTRIAIEQEPGSGGKESAENTVRMLRGYMVTVDLPKGDKKLRATPLSVQVNQGLIYAPENSPWMKDLVAEMRYFPFSKYKDQVDALSAGFNILTRSVPVAGGLSALAKRRQ